MLIRLFPLSDVTNRSWLLICLERPERFAHGCSFPLSDSLTVAHLSWAIWANSSQPLIWFEQNEQMSEWAMSEWVNERWANQWMSDERMSKFPALLILFWKILSNIRKYVVTKRKGTSIKYQKQKREIKTFGNKLVLDKLFFIIHWPWPWLTVRSVVK